MFNLRLTARPTKAIKLNPNATVLEVVIPVFGNVPSLVSALASSLASVFGPKLFPSPWGFWPKSGPAAPGAGVGTPGWGNFDKSNSGTSLTAGLFAAKIARASSRSANLAFNPSI